MGGVKFFKLLYLCSSVGYRYAVSCSLLAYYYLILLSETFFDTTKKKILGHSWSKFLGLSFSWTTNPPRQDIEISLCLQAVPNGIFTSPLHPYLCQISNFYLSLGILRTQFLHLFTVAILFRPIWGNPKTHPRDY